jgi:uncharacterized protein YkwD
MFLRARTLLALALATVSASLVVSASAAAYERCPAAGVPTAGVASIVHARNTMLCYLNNRRSALHRRTLRFSPALINAAQGQVNYNIAHHTFTHFGFGRGTVFSRALAARYATLRMRVHVGEALGWRYGPLSNPAGGLTQILSSAPHRAILDDPRYVDVGIGVAPVAPFDQNRQGATYGLVLGCHC